MTKRYIIDRGHVLDGWWPLIQLLRYGFGGRSAFFRKLFEPKPPRLGRLWLPLKASCPLHHLPCIAEALTQTNVVLVSNDDLLPDTRASICISSPVALHLQLLSAADRSPVPGFGVGKRLIGKGIGST